MADWAAALVFAARVESRDVFLYIGVVVWMSGTLRIVALAVDGWEYFPRFSLVVEGVVGLRQQKRAEVPFPDELRED